VYHWFVRVLLGFPGHRIKGAQWELRLPGLLLEISTAQFNKSLTIRKGLSWDETINSEDRKTVMTVHRTLHSMKQNSSVILNPEVPRIIFILKIFVFCDVTPCNPVDVHQSFCGFTSGSTRRHIPKNVVFIFTAARISYPKIYEFCCHLRT
jgi:hypothetical protein